MILKNKQRLQKGKKPACWTVKLYFISQFYTCKWTATLLDNALERKWLWILQLSVIFFYYSPVMHCFTYDLAAWCVKLHRNTELLSCHRACDLFTHLNKKWLIWNVHSRHVHLLLQNIVRPALPSHKVKSIISDLCQLTDHIGISAVRNGEQSCNDKSLEA